MGNINILGLANARIVETKFLEFAMSLLDFSPRIPLGTFLILIYTVLRHLCVFSLNNLFPICVNYKFFPVQQIVILMYMI